MIDSGHVEMGYYDNSNILEQANNALYEKYHTHNLIRNFSNSQFFIDTPKVHDLGLDLNVISNDILASSLKIDGVDTGWVSTRFGNQESSNTLFDIVKKGWNEKRSGEVILVMKSGWLSNGYADGGSGHGSPWAYDTHVPLLFYGRGVHQGNTDNKTHVEDIVPTVSALIGDSQTLPTVTGKVIKAVID